jgi:3-oxoacyl-[acyl-carrier protein] reductase
VADSDQVKAAVEATVAAFGRIDCVINNAGIIRDRMFHKMTDDEWHAVINVNLNGVYNVCKFIIPMMREQQSGSIVNIASTSLMGNPGQANYAATKAALQGFTRTLAKENGPKNVRVNVIAPGHILTDMMLTVGEERLKAAASYLPMRRLGQPEEIASVAAFLCSEDASWVTGQTIYVAGGGTMN